MTEKNSTNKPITAVRREILESLASGAMLVIDKANIAWLGDRDVSQTRYWLVENKLVQRKDKQMKVDALGNGLIISSKGLDLLKAQPIANNRGSQVHVVNGALGESKPSDASATFFL